ncbi:hypothetical protein B0A50_01331 [Salinomyces thailandicus]|uniref:Uncharacterized protein n=1 Tax=Salinomyces thailandicus TaxID=706561 RepID=A0A4U0UA68_9PEZI|nr:hypothetical protein B0A50_01331 [Salinomyces thailandica]
MDWALPRLVTVAKASAWQYSSAADSEPGRNDSVNTNAACPADEMIPTPSTSHVDYNRVYEPAEDSYLLLDTLSASSESNWLRARFPPTSATPSAVEVGCGSGVVLAFIAANAERLLGRPDVTTFGIDVNEFACKATADTVSLAIKEAGPTNQSVFGGSINGDLMTSLRPGSVDILVCNPPYVPTEELPNESNLDEFADRADFGSDEAFDRDSRYLALAYAGGMDGMEVTNRLLDQLPEALSQHGAAYILLCAQNRPDAVKDRIRSWAHGWSAETVGSSGKKAGWEKLSIIRVWRS